MYLVMRKDVKRIGSFIISYNFIILLIFFIFNRNFIHIPVHLIHLFRTKETGSFSRIILAMRKKETKLISHYVF